MEHPKEIQELLYSGYRRRRRRASGKVDPALSAKRAAAGRKGGTNGTRRAKIKAGRYGGRMRLLSAYRKLNMMNHPTAVELLRQVEAMH